ncbi:MAG TPA: phage tail length tape measure family protein, partial [Azospirillaceae bacterium]|nr:phage tail length tape measure family protein [Azospirillaceae bacterium]
MMTAATETLTTELSVDCKDGVLQIEQMEARLGTVAQTAAAATKVNQAFSRSTAEAGAETEKTSAKLRVYENQTKALEARVASFTARHDPLSKARRDLANAEDLYAKAARRGLEIGEAQLRAMDNLRARTEQLASANDAAARSASANAAALDGVLRQYDRAYAETARYVEEVDRVTAVLNAANVSEAQRAVVLRGVAEAYDPAVRASREAAEALEREAAARQKVIAAAKAQAAAEDAQGRFNQALGVRPVVTGSASASAAVFVEAEQNATALETLRRRYDATYAAEARHREEVAQVMAVTKAANVSDAERAALLAKVEEAHAGAARSTAAHGQALRLLVPQLNDVFVTAAMGMNPLMIAIQQGPQIIDAFVLGGKEAGAEMLRLAATAAPIALLVGTIAALAAAQESYAAALRETARVNTLTGGSSGFSDAGLERNAEAAAKELGMAYTIDK